MKILKFATVTLLAFVLFAFIYANTRALSLSETLEEVDLITFSLRENLSESEKQRLETRIGTTPGVTACSVSKEGDKIAVMFRPTSMSKANVAAAISAFEKTVTPVVYASSGSCPIHKMQGSIDQLISALDLRN